MIKHVVEPGDTLYGISEKYHGEGSMWDLIYIKNKDIIGKDSDLIYVGQVFEIPNTVLLKPEYRK